MRGDLELFDIQGNVLRGYKLEHGWHLFARINDGEAARAWLARARRCVTTAEMQARHGLTAACNIAFSASGLERLDVPPALMAEFSADFRAGMAARAGALRERGEAHPEQWSEPAFRSRAVDVVVSVYDRDDERLSDEVVRLWKELEDHNLKVLHQRQVQRGRGQREHFGFADGFAQPRIDGAPPDRRPVSTSSPAVESLPAGEFLLGYDDLDGAKPPGPPGALGRNGTYMVYREFDQDVMGFRRFLRQQSETSGLPEELLAAKLVGRWRNGTPLVVSPENDRLERGRGDPRLDDFDYGSDPDGYRCPLGAHIRRTNPRDMDTVGLAVSRRHRMIRRGMPYGMPLSDDATDNGLTERGLAFICFVASIERQFEFVVGEWCNDGNAFGLGSETDFLLAGADRPATMTIQGTPPVFLRRPEGLAPFVHSRGGEYFYLPGIAGLRALAEGSLFA